MQRTLAANSANSFCLIAKTDGNISQRSPLPFGNAFTGGDHRTKFDVGISRDERFRHFGAGLKLLLNFTDPWLTLL